MTFFLKPSTQASDIDARGADTPLPSFWGGLGAGISKSVLESNANFKRQRDRIQVQDEMAVEAARTLGQDRIREMADAVNERAVAAGMQPRDIPSELDDIPGVFGPNFSKEIIDAARAETDWKGGDVSEEAIETRLNTRLQKQYDDAVQTLNAMGAGRGAAEFAGEMIGMTADIRNVPFLIAGGGTGSFARIMGREAMLNVGAEAATLPSRFEMAERLDIPDPDIAETLAMAAVGGAVLGGAAEGLGRAIGYWRGTRSSPGADASPVKGFDIEANVNSLEDAMAVSRKPFDVDIPGQPRFRGELDSAPFINGQTIEYSDTVPFGDIPAAAVPVAPRAETIADTIAEAAPAEDAVVAAPVSDRELHRQSGGTRPLIDHLKKNYGGITPSSPLGQELRAMGIRPQDAPGLFRASGRPGFDNIPAADEPHLAAVLGQGGNGYLSEAGMAQAISDEIRGMPTPVTREQATARFEMQSRADEQRRLDRDAGAQYGRELDDELFPAATNRDWMDDPRQVEAVEGHAMQDIRYQVEADDRMVDMMDGRGERPLSSVLADIDDFMEAAEVLALCGRRSA